MADLRIGVRELVELTVRTGDLNPLTTSSNNTAMLGSKWHRKLQANYPEGSETEVYLSQTVTVDQQHYLIDGRADGVLTTKSGVTIEEIKTSARPFEAVTPNTKARYFTQARVYGHFLCQSRHLKRVTLSLVYVQTTTEAISRFDEEWTAEALADEFANLLHEFEDWLHLKSSISRATAKSAAALTFPFGAFRPGQRQLAGVVYKTIASQNRLLVEVPTGTGKTISTLFPAIKAMGKGLCSRLFYLTAKQSTQTVAEATLQQLHQTGLAAKVITLTAKATITFEDAPEDPSHNPYMLGYYDRLKPALKDVLANESLLSREVIEAYAKKHLLDPFEFSLDLSLFCDVIICDYNYLFDPAVFLQRFFTQADANTVFLIDEAHNLPDRARSMYTAAIKDSALLPLQKALAAHKGGLITPIKRHLSQLLTGFDLLKAQQATTRFEKEAPEAFTNLISKLAGAIHDWLSDPELERPDAVMSVLLPVYFDLLAFLRIAERYNEGFVTEIAIDEAITVTLLCLDPSSFIDASLRLGGSAVLFSATLSPMPYYQTLLGSDDSLSYQLPSPFAREHQAVIVATDVLPTYRRREAEIPNLVAKLTVMTAAKPGHYLVFCSAYGLLNQLVEAYQAAHPDAAVVQQVPTMSAEAKAEFLAAFERPEPVIGFAVLGGSFAEGIDLTGERLSGVAIVSVGLPGLNPETDELKRYFDDQHLPGFAYAYRLPGFNHVLQAGGRVIRTASDRGVILLLDARFASADYAPLFPPHWAHAQVSASTNALAKQLTDFWQT